MGSLVFSELKVIEKKCNLFLENENIQFIGVVNQLGNLIVGGFKKDLAPIGTEETRKMMYMQLKLDLDMRKDYDGLYGPVEYVVSKRRDAEKISIPIGNYMILIIAELNFDCGSRIKEIISIFKPYLDNET